MEPHFHQKHVALDPRLAAEVAIKLDASWQDVTIQAPDRVLLKAWLFTPRLATRRAVLFVHGRSGNRQATLVRAQSFLRAGYARLLVDQRGSGCVWRRVVRSA